MDIGNKTRCYRQSKRFDLFSGQWEQKRFESHRKKVENAAPRIDFNTPKSINFQHVKVKITCEITTQNSVNLAGRLTTAVTTPSGLIHAWVESNFGMDLAHFPLVCKLCNFFVNGHVSSHANSHLIFCRWKPKNCNVRRNELTKSCLTIWFCFATWLRSLPPSECLTTTHPKRIFHIFTSKFCCLEGNSWVKWPLRKETTNRPFQLMKEAMSQKTSFDFLSILKRLISTVNKNPCLLWRV